MADFRIRMKRRLLGVTCILHLPFSWMLACAVLPGRAPAPWPIAIVLTLALLVPAPFVIARTMDDRPRSAWLSRGFDVLYFVHWCSLVAMFLPTVALSLVEFVVLGSTRGTWITPTYAPIGSYVASLALAAWSVGIRRHWFHVVEKDIAIPGLPTAFHGYRVVHLSDLHIGSMTSQGTLDRWIAAANEAKADLIVLTGDYVTNGTAFHALIASTVGRLRASDGVFASMGNHDYFGEGQPLIGLLEHEGVHVLRNEGRLLQRGGASVYLAAIDDTWTKRADVDQALTGRPADTRTILLAHDPDAWPLAKAKGVELTLSGHTHGGQVAVPFLARRFSLSHLAHSFHLGHYTDGRSTLYVHPGLGTTGPPVRLGAAPAIAIHRLVSA